MNRTLKIYIAFLVLLLTGIIAIDSNRPKPVDWTPTYAIKDKIPYGMYVFNAEIGSLLKNQKIEQIKVTLYEFLESKYNYDTLVADYKIKGTILNARARWPRASPSLRHPCRARPGPAEPRPPWPRTS